MKILSCSILFIFATLGIHCCYNTPAVSEVPAEKIQVGPGPEDMVLDTLQGNPRLIISCSARRESHEPYGEIVSLDLHTGSQVKLLRYNEPGDVVFRPHGIYLDKDILFVISHELEPDYHPILVYRLHGDSLEFKELINTPQQNSPNALVTGPEGEIYFVNDSGKRGSLAEKAFRLKRANVVRLMKNPDGRWESAIMAVDLGYPAGINRVGNKLYVGDAILHRIHIFNISSTGLSPAGELKGLRGNDNIRIHNG